MSECKHRWAIRITGPVFLDDSSTKLQEVYCLKCGKTVNDLLYDKDRQLDAAARDLLDTFVVSDDVPYPCGDCEMGRICGYEPFTNECVQMWRKRWEEAANDD